jgi:hypothetical protein
MVRTLCKEILASLTLTMLAVPNLSIDERISYGKVYVSTLLSDLYQKITGLEGLLEQARHDKAKLSEKVNVLESEKVATLKNEMIEAQIQCSISESAPVENRDAENAEGVAPTMASASELIKITLERDQLIAQVRQMRNEHVQLAAVDTQAKISRLRSIYDSKVQRLESQLHDVQKQNDRLEKALKKTDEYVELIDGKLRAQETAAWRQSQEQALRKTISCGSASFGELNGALKESTAFIDLDSEPKLTLCRSDLSERKRKLSKCDLLSSDDLPHDEEGPEEDLGEQERKRSVDSYSIGSPSRDSVISSVESSPYQNKSRVMYKHLPSSQS